MDLTPLTIDVGVLVSKTVTSLHSHLVTRPTGRAVRLAIEAQMASTGVQSLSIIDLSDVTILDFSCADEVIAKLLQGYLEPDSPEAFFMFRGIRESHRDQIQVVLERQALVAVAETDTGVRELLGVIEAYDTRVWQLLETEGPLVREDFARVFPEPILDDVLDRLRKRRIVFQNPISGRYHALSQLVDDPL